MALEEDRNENVVKIIDHFVDVYETFLRIWLIWNFAHRDITLFYNKTA